MTFTDSMHDNPPAPFNPAYIPGFAERLEREYHAYCRQNPGADRIQLAAAHGRLASAVLALLGDSLRGRIPLSQWAEAAGVKPTARTTWVGATSVLSLPGYPLHAELWRLSDYVVSTVSGPVVWLIPRPTVSE